MSLKNNLLLFLFLATLSHEIFGQRGGFLDKKNQLDVDLFEMTQQNRFSLGYKFSYREHLGFTARVSYQGLRNWELEDYITVGVDQNGSEINKYVTYGSYSVKSFEAGAGLLFNSKNTGFALPLGNYMSIMYLIHSSSHSETVDSLNLTSNYKNNGAAIRFSFGRTIYLVHNTVLDLGLHLGFNWGKASFDATTAPPRYIFPTTNFWTGVDQVKLRDKHYFRFYFLPAFKIGFLF